MIPLNLPLPQPLRGDEPGSFANYSVTTRWPNIARRTLTETQFPPAIAAALQSLLDDLPHRQIRPLTDTAAPDARDWQTFIAPYTHDTWLSAPWYFTEAYFYRRILEATGYFVPGPGFGVDPFAQQKILAWQSAYPTVCALSRQLATAPPSIAAMLILSLWGNRADLSMWPLNSAAESRPELPQNPEDIIVDHSQIIANYLLNHKLPVPRVDLITDNVGFELACDLLLVDYLLTHTIAATVILNLKAHPTFVSDVTLTDAIAVITAFAADSDAAMNALGNRLQNYLAENRLRLCPHYFWNAPVDFRQMPAGLQTDLAQSTLVIAKGDANYRRLLGDLHWDFSESFAQITGYFPAPIVALRVSKSQLAAGIPSDVVNQLNRLDPAWMINGTKGVIQFTEKRASGNQTKSSAL